jgi:predicted small secreted protein
MKTTYFIVILIAGVFILQGCGETVRGVSGDAHRITRGVKTIFISDSN